MSALRDMAAAFGWLSIVPVAAHADARPARWFPLVGWAFGGTAAGIAYAVGLARGGALVPLLGGAVVVCGWAVLSRLLHWDGVADTADGLLGGSTPERRLEIMHDSRTGAFGVTAVTLGIVLQVAACGALIEAHAIWPLLAAPVLGRFSATAGLWTLPPARREGLAARLSAAEGPLAWVAAAGLCLPLLAGGTLARGVVLASGMMLAIMLPRMLAKPVGGISGDLLGASVVIVETLVLVSCACMTGVLV